MLSEHDLEDVQLLLFKGVRVPISYATPDGNVFILPEGKRPIPIVTSVQAQASPDGFLLPPVHTADSGRDTDSSESSGEDFDVLEDFLS